MRQNISFFFQVFIKLKLHSYDDLIRKCYNDKNVVRTKMGIRTNLSILHLRTFSKDNRHFICFGHKVLVPCDSTRVTRELHVKMTGHSCNACHSFRVSQLHTGTNSLGKG